MANFLTSLFGKSHLREGASGLDAVRRLAADNSASAAAKLGEAVNGEDMTVARAAMKALIDKGTPDAVAALGTALRAAMITRAQGKPASGGYGPYYAASNRIQELIGETAKLGTPTAPALLDVLQRRASELAAPRPYERADHTGAAARALGEMKYAPAVPVLIGLLSDPNDVVRSSAASALGALKAKVAVPNLIAGLDDPYARLSMALALGEIGDPRAAADVEKLLDDRESYVRASIGEVLAKLGWKPSTGEGRVRVAIASRDWAAAGREGAAALHPILSAIWRTYGLETPRGKANPWERLIGKKKTHDVKYLPDDELVAGLVKALGNCLQGQGPFDARYVGYVAAMPDLPVQYEAQYERTDYGSGQEYIDRVQQQRLIDCNAVRTRARALA